MSLKYSNDTTSFQAAVDNLPRAGTQKARVLEQLAARPGEGATRPELALLLNLSENAVRPRVVELIEVGLIEETEQTRRTRSGSQATVLVAKNVGSSTESHGEAVASAEGSSPSLGVASGVERADASPGDAPPANPYTYELWAA